MTRVAHSAFVLIDSANSVDKALVLHQLLQAAGGPVRLHALSLSANLPKSTTHRLLSSLVRAGLVTRFGLGYVACGPANGSDYATHAASIRRYAPFVSDVAAQTGLTASLAHLVGTAVVFTHRVFTHNNVVTASDDGEPVAATETAAGLCLLAQDIQRLADFHLPENDVATVTRAVIKIAYNGYAIRSHADAWCMAVPLPEVDGMPRLALTVKGHPGTRKEHKLLHFLRGVAQAAVKLTPPREERVQ